MKESVAYLKRFATASLRLQALYTTTLEVVFWQQKKVLVVMALRSSGVQAEAIMARHGGKVRTDFQKKFNRPLSHWVTGGAAFNRSNDNEVLVLNYANQDLFHRELFKFVSERVPPRTIDAMPHLFDSFV